MEEAAEKLLNVLADAIKTGVDAMPGVLKSALEDYARYQFANMIGYALFALTCLLLAWGTMAFAQKERKAMVAYKPKDYMDAGGMVPGILMFLSYGLTFILGIIVLINLYSAFDAWTRYFAPIGSLVAKALGGAR